MNTPTVGIEDYPALRIYERAVWDESVARCEERTNAILAARRMDGKPEATPEQLARLRRKVAGWAITQGWSGDPTTAAQWAKANGDEEGERLWLAYAAQPLADDVYVSVQRHYGFLRDGEQVFPDE